MIQSFVRRCAISGAALAMVLVGSVTSAVAAPAVDDAALDAAAHAKAGAAAREASRAAPRAVEGLPSVNGPTYTFREGQLSGPDLFAVVSLPFNYTLDDVSWGIESRRFTTTSGQVCTYLRLWKVSGGTPYTSFGVTLWEDINNASDKSLGRVSWPVDNTTYQYCWTPVTNNRTYYFSFGYGSGGNDVYVDGVGTAQASL